MEEDEKVVQSPPRMLTRHASRMEQHLYWSQKSVPERLAGAAELTKRLYRLRGIDLDEQTTDLTPRRVSRRRG